MQRDRFISRYTAIEKAVNAFSERKKCAASKGWTFAGDLCGSSVELCISHVERHIDSYFEYVQEIEGPAEIEQEAETAARGKFDELPGDAKYVADEYEHLEEQAFALCRAGLVRAVYGDGPGKAETDYHERFQKIEHFRDPSS